MASLYRNSAEDTDPTIVKGGTVINVTSPNPVNSGIKSWQMNTAAAISYVELTPTTTSGTFYYARAYFYITGAPGGLMRMLQTVTAASGVATSVRLATDRSLNMYDSLGNYVIDGTYATAPLALNAWHFVELGVMVNTSTGSGQAGFRLNGTLVVPMTVCNTGTSLINRVRAGKDTATTIAGLFTDDFALNDSTTGTDNSWVGSIGAGSSLWRADAEAAMNQEWASSTSWRVGGGLPTFAPLSGTGSSQPDPTRISQDATFKAQGTKSYRFEVRSTDDGGAGVGVRSELGTASPPGEFGSIVGGVDRWFYDGQERWISMQFYCQGPWTSSSWGNLLQIKPNSGGGGGPNVGLSAGQNQRLVGYGNTNVWGSTDGTIFDWTGGPYFSGIGYDLPLDKWFKVTLYVRFSADPAIGQVQWFFDLNDGSGWRTMPLRTRATMKYISGGVTDPSQLRVGIYRDPTITETWIAWCDGVTVATTRALAEANAFSGGGGGGPGTTLVTPSWVTPPTPTAGSTVTGQTPVIEATTSDNTKVSKIDYYKELARNYHQNPTTEIDITGWVSNGSPPVAPVRVTDFAESGTASLKITADALFDGASYQLPGTSSLPASKTWTASFSYYVVSHTGSNIGTIALRERTSSAEVGNTIGNFDLSKTGWNTASVTRTFGATGVDLELQIVTFETSASFDIRVDNLMITDNATQPYFNGDSTGAIWLGTAHQSASSLRQLLNTQLFSPYDWPWDTTVVSNGEANMIARVTQTDGQTTEISRIFNVSNTGALTNRMVKIGGTFVTKPITIKVNGAFTTKPIYLIGYNNPPPPATSVTAIWQTPSSGATISGTQVVTITTNDDARVDNVEFKISGSTVAVEADPPWSWSWNTTTQSNGPISVTAVVHHTDAAPDVTLTRDFVLDNTTAPAPTVGANRLIPVTDWGMNDTAMRNGIARTSTTTQPFVPGSVGWVTAIRCVFDETFTLEELWASVKGRGTSWWHGGVDGTIYASGNGGILNCRLVPVTTAGQPLFTDTTNMLGEELNIDPATRYNAVEASYPSRFGFSFTSGDGPMLWWFKPRKSGVAPVIQAGTVYAFCIWNSHPQPGVNFMATNMMTIREYIWPPSTPGIATWPTSLKSGGSGRARSPNVIDNMDANCPGAIGGMDPRECLMYSANGGSTFPWVGRLGLSLAPSAPAYAGAAEPSDDGARIPCIAYSKAGSPNTVIKGDKSFGYSGSAGGNATTSLAYTSPVFPRATTLTHAWAYTPSGVAVGNIVVTHKRGAATIATATASGGSLNDTTGGMEIGSLSSNLNLLTGDHYIADPSGQVMTYQNDANNKPWTSVVRPQVGCLPNPFFVGGTGRDPTSTTAPNPNPNPNPSGLSALTYSPPTLTSPINYTLPTGVNQTVNLSTSQDYILNSSSILSGGLRINGGRNIIWRGGHVQVNYVGTFANFGGTALTWYRARAAPEFSGFTGHLFIEGFLMDGNDCGEGIVATSSSASAIFTLQAFRIGPLLSRAITRWTDSNVNNRILGTYGSGLTYTTGQTVHPFETGSGNYTAIQGGKHWDVHADAFQTYGPAVKTIRLAKGTVITTVQLNFIESMVSGSSVIFKDLNVLPYTFLGVDYVGGNTINKSANGGVDYAFSLDNVWLKNTAEYGTTKSNYTASYDGASSSWEPSLNLGVPSGGDFVSASQIGLGYVSPGYV